MTKKQSVLFMNILAKLFAYLQRFTMPFQMIHALADFECVGERIRHELEKIIFQNDDLDDFLQLLHQKVCGIVSEQNQESILSAYHMCIWMDQRLTYEDISKKDTKGKLSIYDLIPMRAYSYNEIDSLNDNYEEVGIWINPKLPIFKSVSLLDNGEERDRITSNRHAFSELNGELCNICYFVWKPYYVIHNIIIPYEYEEESKEDKTNGHLRVGFVPVSDRQDLIVPHYKNVAVSQYELKKMYIDHPNHEQEIETRLAKGLELACANDVDIVFAPEMLGTKQMELLNGNYNMFIRGIYESMLINGNKPPVITILPSYWEKETNSAAIVYRDGRVLGRQKKYTPYIDFKSCSVEGIKQDKIREIYLIHIYGVHRIAISICAEFIDNFDSRLICGELGVTLMIVPSFSHGERDFINSIATLFPYGTSVVWGDCCGAVTHSPRIIGGCSLVGCNEIYKMGDFCKCSFLCANCKGCLFTIDLPIKIVMSKSGQTRHEAIDHILY